MPRGWASGIPCNLQNAYTEQAIHDLHKIVNYHELNAADSADFVQQRASQLALQADSAIPHRFRIPPELISYRKSGNKQYFIKYNTSRSTFLGFVPSDLVSYYELISYRYYKKDKFLYPSLSVVLAQQFTESLFNPTLKGDGGKSVGLPQLHRPTAKWLLEVDRKTWDRFFYFDKNMQHFFRNIATQVEFPFLFLPHYKKYTQNAKFEGLKRYNGSGQKARTYAQLIIGRSIFYEEILNKKYNDELDTNVFKRQVKDIINMGLYNKEVDALDDSEFDGIFGEIQALFHRGMRIQTYLNQISVNDLENSPIQLANLSQFEIPTGGESYFFILEEGRSLFSYFMSMDEMVQTLNMTENELIYIFFYNNGDLIKITTRSQMTGQKVFTNARPGDRIFLKPGTRIYSPDADIVIRVASK